MRVHYDSDEDILYLVVREGPIADSREIDADIRVEYNGEGEVVGIEIMNARRNLAQPLVQSIAKELQSAAH